MNDNVNTVLLSYAVGSPLPHNFPSDTPGAILEFGGITSAPTVLIGIDNPSQEELEALSSRGKYQCGITVCDSVAYLLSRYSLNGESILSLDSPYHAGISGNDSQEFQDKLREFSSAIGSNPKLGLWTTQIVFDLNTKIIRGIRGFTLPHCTSKLLLKQAAKQVCEPISHAEYFHKVQDAYRRYPTWNSMRKHAITWEKVGSHV